MHRLSRSLALLLLAGASALAQQPLSSRDIATLRSVSSVAISPDGSLVAVTRSVPRAPFDKGKDGPGFSELHLVGADGRERPYVTGDVNVGDVAFSADGREILFLAKRGADRSRALYSIPTEGGEARKLLEFETDLGGFAFHPTTRRVTFLAAVPTPKPRKEREEKGFNQEIFEEDWAPVRVYVASLDRSAESEKGPGKAQSLPLDGSASDLRASADGKWLLVNLAPTPGIDDSYMRKRLHVVDAFSGKVRGDIDHVGKIGPATFSPDGKLVAFIAASDEHDPQPGRLVIAPADGGVTRALLPDFAGHFVTCAFKDEKTLYYLADRGVETILGELSVDGSGNRELVAQPGFVVTGFSVSKDGRSVALVAQTATQPPEAYRWSEGAAPTRLTRSNRLDAIALAPQEPFHWKARDGLDLEGILIHPLGEEAGKQYPLLVVVHGGPEAHYRNGWLTNYASPGQVAAGRGYAVFHPNYRASTGRGVEFSMLDHKDPAGKEFDDVVDGVDALIAKGLVDKSKVGVTGGSYGGYATAWFATKYNDRFAAAVMGFGIADLVSMIGTSDIPHENYLVHQRVHPWEDWQLFLDRSPITHAKDAKTPLLILAGKADPRVPPSQSMELYRYLKEEASAPVRLVLYPGEGHGNSRAASRLDYHLRMMQWFDHYLKGPGGKPPFYEIDYGKELGAAKADAKVGANVGVGDRVGDVADGAD